MSRAVRGVGWRKGEEMEICREMRILIIGALLLAVIGTSGCNVLQGAAAGAAGSAAMSAVSGRDGEQILRDAGAGAVGGAAASFVYGLF